MQINDHLIIIIGQFKCRKRIQDANNLKATFAGESQANRRYPYFAQNAKIEAYNDVSAFSALLRKAKLDMRIATLCISKN
jgi:rubrerythrin